MDDLEPIDNSSELNKKDMTIETQNELKRRVFKKVRNIVDYLDGLTISYLTK